MKIAIAGASGFIGRHLIERLHETHEVRALSRSVIDGAEIPGTTARALRTNLFSLLDAERALDGVDVAYYLVHSMAPSARLTQGHFADLDATLADNFGRAAASQGVKQIICLGGLVPQDEELSSHLHSRREVEAVLGAHGVPVTALRAGLVVGPNGSSFRILTRLVKRLPMMACPQWTRTLSQPIGHEATVEILARCAGDERTYGDTFDIGGPDKLTYRDMIATTARIYDRTPRLIDLPFITPRLSTLWVSMVTGSPRELVGPLVQSLEHEMLARDRRLQEMLGVPGIPFEEAARAARAVEESGSVPAPMPRAPALRVNDVRSIQRVDVPPGRDAYWLAEEYMRWLPRAVRPLLRVEVDDRFVCRFKLALTNTLLLQLEYSRDRSNEDRSLLYITGGLLAQQPEGVRGRLEFRRLPNSDEALAAVHDFVPRLPWWLYSSTQAQVHLLVMHFFGRHLKRVGERSPAALPAGAP